MVKYNYDKLRGLVREHFGTLQNYANFLEISTVTLNSRLSNKTFFDQKEIEKSIKGFNMNSADEVKAVFFTHK